MSSSCALDDISPALAPVRTVGPVLLLDSIAGVAMASRRSRSRAISKDGSEGAGPSCHSWRGRDGPRSERREGRSPRWPRLPQEVSCSKSVSSRRGTDDFDVMALPDICPRPGAGLVPLLSAPRSATASPKAGSAVTARRSATRRGDSHRLAAPAGTRPPPLGWPQPARPSSSPAPEVCRQVGELELGYRSAP